MKKFALFLIFSILLTSLTFPFTVLAQDEVKKEFNNTIIDNTKNLFTSLKIDFNNTNDYESEVTRRDFTYILMQLLASKGSASANAHGFSDVDDSVFNFMLGQAVNSGIVSKGEYFEPERYITYAEAIKMAVIALGYANEASNYGGYPIGYIIAANRINLTDGVSFNNDDKLCFGDMMMLVSNFVNIDIRIQTGYGSSYEYRVTDDHTVLSEYFKLKKISGIIEGNEVTSLYDKNLKCCTGHIVVAGQSYIYTGNYILGARVDAYVTTDAKYNSIVYMQNTDTIVTEVFPAQTPLVNGNIFAYDDEELRMSSHVAVLYNGQAYMAYSESDFSIKSGNIILIDNDGNKTIDVIHINESEIFIVSEINLLNNIIFTDGGSRLIDLNNSDIPCRILLNGEVAQLNNIGQNSVISCYSNKDGATVMISASTNTVSGVLKEISTVDQYLYIDDNKFYYNEYFKTNSLHNMTPGANTVFMLDSNGYITSTSMTVTDMKYGYMVGIADPPGLSEGPVIKIFTQTGNVIIYKLAQKVKIDAQSAISAEDVVNMACFKNNDGSVKEQLIRFDVNEKEEVSIIDTEYSKNDHTTGVVTTGFYDDKADPYDMLKRYSYTGYDTSATLAYKSTGVMVPYFYLSINTPILVVNADTTLPDEERYSVATRTMFIKDLRYTCMNMYVYNVKEDGGAGIMVYIDRVGSGSSALDTESAYGIVESFNQAIIPATGETGYRLSVFDGSTFKDLYVRNISTLESLYTGNDKENGELPLSPGDFIRYTADGRSIIKSVAKDFDESNKKVLNYATTGDNSTMRYDFGKVYAKSSASMLMVSTTNNAEDITNGTADLKCINVSNIGILYDSATKTVSPASYNDIIPYVYSPELCSTVFIRNRYALGYMFVIYK